VRLPVAAAREADDAVDRADEIVGDGYRPRGGEERAVGVGVLMQLRREQRLDHGGGRVRRHRRAASDGARDERAVRGKPADDAPVVLRRRREAVGEVVGPKWLVTDGARREQVVQLGRPAQRETDDEVDLRVAAESSQIGRGLDAIGRGLRRIDRGVARAANNENNEW
jgi:hypothetical protein